MITLVKPSIKYFDSLNKLKIDFLDNKETRIQGSGALDKYDDLSEWLKSINEIESGLNPKVVPTLYYLILSDEEVVGTICIRMELTKDLEEFGGHIGYSIKPSSRKKGYAKESLSQILKIYNDKFDELLVICEENNIASNKVIISNGGILINKIEKFGLNINRYKITKTNNNLLEFRKPNYEDIIEINAFKEEFVTYNSSMDGTGILCECDAKDWIYTNQIMENINNPKFYKYLQYGLFDNRRLLGLIQIRTELKGYLVEYGGHIGYCVRPTERRNGYAKIMLTKALEVCKEIGLNKVLITCLENNLASAKTIEACGGEFEKTVYDNLNYKANMKRYWIKL